MTPIRHRKAWSTSKRLPAQNEASGPATSAPAFTAAAAWGPCMRKRTTALCALSLAVPWVPAAATVAAAGEDALGSPASSLSSRIDGWSNSDEHVRQLEEQQQRNPLPVSRCGGTDSASVSGKMAGMLDGQAPADEAITAPLTTPAAVATTTPNVARGTLMVAVEGGGYHESEIESSTAHMGGRPQGRHQRRRRPGGEAKLGSSKSISNVGRGWTFRPSPDGLQSNDDPTGSNGVRGPRESGSRKGISFGATEPGMSSSSAPKHSEGADIAPRDVCSGREEATATTSFADRDGALQSPLPDQPAESRTTTTRLGQQHPGTKGPAARADATGSSPDSGGVLAGRPNCPVGGGNGAMIAVCAGAVAGVLPELVRACKLMAFAGIAFRSMRWLTGAIRAARPRWERRQESIRGEKVSEGSRGGGAKSLRRARESILLQTDGMRVPEEVVSSLDEAELEVTADLVDCDELDVTFEDIAGMDDIKHSLQEIISEPLDFPPDLYPARLIKPCSGVLIYGPPGCGKTLLARAVAKQSGAAFISVKASTLMRKPGFTRVGGSAGVSGAGGHSSLMVRAVFSLAKKIQPCVIFFDEADGLCFKREEGEAGSEREVMTELMQLWDGLSSAGQERVVVLAATNRPWDLDPAIQRRFSRSFQVGLPDRQMRKAVLMKALEDVDVEDGFDWREVAVMTEGYSCGDVMELCREAVRGPLREAIERNRRRKARHHNQGLHQSRLNALAAQKGHQQRRRWNRGERQDGVRGADSMASETVAMAAASAEAAQLPPVRMRPLRMSDVTAAQRRVVPAFWQAEAYRTTYDSYMGSLMEHARQNWSR